MLRGIWLIIRRYFIAGLLLWLPIWVTLLVLHFLINLLESSFSLLPERYQPAYLIGFNIPGLGLIISVVIVLLTGMLITNFLGNRLVLLWEALLSKIPLVRTIYTSVKQVLQTILSSDAKAFRKVLLIEYPRLGTWTIALQAGEPGKRMIEGIAQKDLITVFVPTTPNPTSGFLLLVPRNQVVEVDMTVEQAFKWIISLGVMQPANNPPTKKIL